MMSDARLIPAPRARVASLVLLTAALAACGSDAPPSTAAAAATTSAALSLAVTVAPATARAVDLQPTFHVAPVQLDEPDDTDTVVNDVSAAMQPHLTSVPASLSRLSTRRLTREVIEAALHDPASAKELISMHSIEADPSATPMAAGSVVATYSPAQIRAAYGLPALPASGSAIGPSQAAQLGAGQTVYIIDAMNNPNVAAELAAFNQKFGLNSCIVMPIATNANLPLAAPPAAGCALSVVYSTASGAMTAAAPAYDSGWSTEISLDVQWVHATAPLARIVLIEAPDASATSLVAAINLANAMGPGVVSMSFGASEGGLTAAYDNAFSAANMTYVASSGDSGASVNWPAASTRVLAVGGTSLTYTGSAARTEVAWSGSSGGTSKFTLAPSYQTSAVPGMGIVTYRNVPDVAFNANPATGQYVAVMPQAGTTLGWVSAGGTSLSAPQWAAMIAVANAVRVQSTKPSIGAPHSLLYGQVASAPVNYSSAFADIVQGSNGTCAACGAKAGYDTVTGLGTPNVGALLPLLTNAPTAPPAAPPAAPRAPVVASAAIAGRSGSALSFALSVVDSGPVNYALSGAPVGMTVNSAGTLNWPSPIAGIYNVTVTATDPKTGLSGSGVLKITIAAPGPTISAAPISGTAGKPVSGTIVMSDAGATSLSVKISGIPSGMKVAANGLTITASWAAPLAGSYSLTIAVVDSAGLSARASLPVTIAAH